MIENGAEGGSLTGLVGADVKFLLIDPHYVVREGLQHILGATYPGSSFSAVAAYCDAAVRFAEDRPHLTIIEINLAGGSAGLFALRGIRQVDPRARVLVLSTHGDAMYVSAAMEAGATGFVSKSASPDQILAAVRAVLSDKTFVHGIVDVYERGSSKAKGFTPRETEIFRLLGEGHTAREISVRMGLAYKTIANACLKMKEKLGVERTSDLVLFAIQGLHADLVTERSVASADTSQREESLSDRSNDGEEH